MKPLTFHHRLPPAWPAAALPWPPGHTKHRALVPCCHWTLAKGLTRTQSAHYCPHHCAYRHRSARLCVRLRRRQQWFQRASAQQGGWVVQRSHPPLVQSSPDTCSLQVRCYVLCTHARPPSHAPRLHAVTLVNRSTASSQPAQLRAAGAKARALLHSRCSGHPQPAKHTLSAAVCQPHLYVTRSERSHVVQATHVGHSTASQSHQAGLTNSVQLVWFAHGSNWVLYSW